MNLFARQSVTAKAMLALLLLVCVLLADLLHALLLMALMLLYLCPAPRLMLDWLRLLARLSLLLAGFFLLGLLAAIPFPAQTLLCLRIAFCLLLSVWLARTSRLEALVAELRPLRRVPIVHDALWFSVGTLLWLPAITQSLETARARCAGLRSLPAAAMDALGEAMERMDDVERRATDVMKSTNARKKSLWDNLLLPAPAVAAILVLVCV